MKHGLLHGKGEFVWKDGTRYKGEFTMNEITGKGEYFWTDGSHYKGTVKNGMRNGSGVYENKVEGDGGVSYEGEWKDGLRHGKGVLKYKNGAIYDGEWEEGQKKGNGKMTYASGNYYEGEWSGNKRNGEGVMHWETSKEKYTGHWENGLQNGFGTHIWLESSGENKLLRNRYVGYWKDGLRHGQGVFYYSNGSKYEGDWRGNLKHGFGIFTFEDGTTYEGPFDNDRMVNRTLAGVANIDNDPPSRKAGKSKEKGGKFVASSRVKKEVEQNPFKTLIDITDLLEMEDQDKAKEIEKEIQNILLRHNSDMKKWYKYYAKKVEAEKTEESFALTLRQIWRFFRDTKLVSCNSTLAAINRIFNQGKKNHFTLLGAKDKAKFLAKQKKPADQAINDDPTEGNNESTAQAQASDEREIKVETMPGGALNIDASSKHSEIKGDQSVKEGDINDASFIDNQNVEIEKEVDMLDSESEDELNDLIQSTPEDLHNPRK